VNGGSEEDELAQWTWMPVEVEDVVMLTVRVEKQEVLRPSGAEPLKWVSQAQAYWEEGFTEPEDD
jgi:hypothetical protein